MKVPALTSIETDPMSPMPSPGHILGDVTDDWQAVEVWLDTLRANNRSPDTVKTYRFHLAKLRWYCEHVGRMTPSRWTAKEVNHFFKFLARLPIDALCAKPPDCAPDLNKYVKEGDPGWTPFRSQPSASSQSDIRRFVHALFNAWHKTGYIRISPMALIGAESIRKVNANRAIPLDLYDLVLTQIATKRSERFVEQQMQVRDYFIFEALRGLGLRTSELVLARMGAFRRIADAHKYYWVFYVTAESSKGGIDRCVPVPPNVWQAFVNYRAAFRLPTEPSTNDTMPLLLSPRTKDVMIGATAIKTTASRRFFKAWGEITTRFGLYRIVKQRLNQTAEQLRADGQSDLAEQLIKASPHWLRHTFGKAKVQEGLGMRQLSSALGHASTETSMIYTEQETLDLIYAYEKANPNSVASEKVLSVPDKPI